MSATYRNAVERPVISNTFILLKLLFKLQVYDNVASANGPNVDSAKRSNESYVQTLRMANVRLQQKTKVLEGKKAEKQISSMKSPLFKQARFIPICFR